MELDTGAAVSVISRSIKDKYLPNVPLQESQVVLRTYTNEKLPIVGEMKVHVFIPPPKTNTDVVCFGTERS